MNDKDLLECCQSILNFLMEDDLGNKLDQSGHRLRHQLTLPTPMQKIMYETLTRNGWGRGYADMIEFTEFLNDKFQMGYQIKQKDSYRPFFSSEAIGFYKQFMRRFKLDLIS